MNINSGADMLDLGFELPTSPVNYNRKDMLASFEAISKQPKAEMSPLYLECLSLARTSATTLHDAAMRGEAVAALRLLRTDISKLSQMTVSVVVFYFLESLLPEMRELLCWLTPDIRLAAIDTLLLMCDVGSPVALDFTGCRRMALYLFTQSSAEHIASHLQNDDLTGTMARKEPMGLANLVARISTAGRWATWLGGGECESDTLGIVNINTIVVILAGMCKFVRRFVPLELDTLVSFATLDGIIVLLRQVIAAGNVLGIAKASEMAKDLTPLIPLLRWEIDLSSDRNQKKKDEDDESGLVGFFCWQDAEMKRRRGKSIENELRSINAERELAARILDTFDQMMQILNSLGGESNLQIRSVLSEWISLGMLDRLHSLLLCPNSALHTRTVIVLSRIFQNSSQAVAKAIDGGMLQTLAASIAGVNASIAGRAVRTSTLAKYLTDLHFRGFKLANRPGKARGNRESAPIALVSTVLTRLNSQIVNALNTPVLDARLFQYIRGGNITKVRDFVVASLIGEGELEGEEKGVTPLMMAAAISQPAMVRTLIELRGDVSQKGVASSLHFAIGYGRADNVHVLLQHKASPATADVIGQTPLSLAQLRTAATALWITENVMEANDGSKSGRKGGSNAAGGGGGGASGGSSSGQGGSKQIANRSEKSYGDGAAMLGVTSMVEDAIRQLALASAANMARFMTSAPAAVRSALAVVENSGASGNDDEEEEEEEEDGDDEDDDRDRHRGKKAKKKKKVTAMNETQMTLLKSFLSKSVRNRSDQDIERVEETIRGFPSLSSLSLPARKAVARHMFIDNRTQGSTIAKAGESMETLFVLLSGEVALKPTTSKKKSSADDEEEEEDDPIRKLVPGQAFGLDSLSAESSSSAFVTCDYDVICMEDVELLAVHRSACRAAVKRAHEKEREVRVGFLLGQYTMPNLRTPLDHDQHTIWLNHTFMPALNSAANHLKLRTYQQGAILAVKGGICEKLFFLVRGQAEEAITCEFYREKAKVHFGEPDLRELDGDGDNFTADAHNKAPLPFTTAFAIRKGERESAVIERRRFFSQTLRLRIFNAGECMGDVDAWNGNGTFQVNLVAVTPVQVYAISHKQVKTKFPDVLLQEMKTRSVVKAARRKQIISSMLEVKKRQGLATNDYAALTSTVTPIQTQTTSSSSPTKSQPLSPTAISSNSNNEINTN